MIQLCWPQRFETGTEGLGGEKKKERKKEREVSDRVEIKTGGKKKQKKRKEKKETKMRERGKQGEKRKEDKLIFQCYVITTSNEALM